MSYRGHGTSDTRPAHTVEEFRRELEQLTIPVSTPHEPARGWLHCPCQGCKVSRDTYERGRPAPTRVPGNGRLA